MDLKEIKSILEKEKGKLVIVEDGRPVMIILPYESSASLAKEEKEEDAPLPEEEPPEPGELTIDDLPI